MSEKGYITIQRKIAEWRWWGNPNAMALWLYILVKANWQDRWWDHGKEMVKRGEFISSQVKIAEDLNMNRKTVTKYLKLFAEEGQIELSVDNSKTRIKVINYAKYQDVPEEHGQHDGQPNGQLDGQHSGQPDGQHDGHNRTIKEPLRTIKEPLKNQYIHQWFGQFWKMYPRKEGKQNALKAFEKVCASEDTFNAIMDGLRKRNQLDWSRRPKDELRFIPHPTTWLNQSRWNDEVIPYASKGDGVLAGKSGRPEDYKEETPGYTESVLEFFDNL